jgi:ligand-binding SRPBCC domain-containing protein
MKTFEINMKQYINKPLDVVFEFFSKPENLEMITPESLSFNILTPTPIKMEKGSLIDYTIRLFGIPIHWRTLISDYEPPFRFVDQQIKGPYTFWHHTHTFQQVDGGVEIIDKVKYSLPMGWLGTLVHSIWVRKDLEKIFEHRKTVIQDYFKILNISIDERTPKS